MARSRKSAKAAGAKFERQVADYLRDHVDDRIDRRVKMGSADRGDIANVRTPANNRVVVECKDTARPDLSGWAREAEVERINDSALVGVVVHKRVGKGQPADQWVAMTLADLVALLTESRAHTEGEGK